MKNVDFIFKFNTTKNYRARFNDRSKRIEVLYTDRIIDGKAITELLGLFTGIVTKYGKIHPPVLLDLSRVNFADKLTYITLECIIFCMIEQYNFDVLLVISGQNKITASGWRDSPMIRLTSKSKENRKKFADEFYFRLNRNHFRRIVIETGDNVAASKAYDDVSDFIKFSTVNLDEDCADEITNVIAELISNAIEHGDDECLVDVDIARGFYNKDDTSVPKTEYFVISVVVLNFSLKLVGEGLRKKLLSGLRLPERYSIISEALANHQKYFNDKYIEEDFYNVAIFQDHISGRLDESRSGGTGMVKLVKALEDRAEVDNCYLLSGRRVLVFKKEHLEYKNGWIGFNDSNDFTHSSPDEDVVLPCSLFFPGVAYNLQFVIERTDDENNKN